MSILVFGSINVDHVMRVARIPRPGETVLAEAMQLYFGGKGANQAVAAARASRRRGAVRMLGAVGQDDLAQRVRHNFVANDVGADALAVTPAQTGSAYIAVDPTGENAITVVPGANAALSATAFSEGVLAGTSHAICQAEVPLAAVLGFAKRYKAATPAGHLTLNLAPVPEAGETSVLKDLLALTDLLVVNQHEAAQAAAMLTGTPDLAPEAAARALSARSGASVVVTLGADGALASPPDDELIAVNIVPITPVDTTGAGDTFVGVLVAGLADGLDLPVALGRAGHAGALACRAIGAQSAMPTADELDGEVA